MFKTKTLTGILLILAVLFIQVGTVFAAPAAQDTALTGNIVSVEPSTDANGVTTYLITISDGTNQQTVRVSYETAVALGLFVIDPNTNEPALDPTTGEPVLDTSKIGTSVELTSDQILPDEDSEDEDVHPISQILADFFNLDAGDVDQFHEDGFGFGVIAQALWIARDDEGNTDSELAGDILIAKQDKDFATFFENHPEYAEEFGDNLPTNWGQFKKVLRDKHENLGNVVSGHAEDDTTQEHGNGNGNGHGNGNGNGNGNGHGNGNGNGHGKP